MTEVESIMIEIKTTTGTSAVSRAIKSTSGPAVGNSTTSTGVGKRVSHWKDNESEWHDCVGVGPDWMECVMFRGRERGLVFSGLEENSSPSKAVTRLSAPDSECAPWAAQEVESWE